jgi:hypothetical protein
MNLIIGVISIATQDYIHYWEKMVLSSIKGTSEQLNFKFYVFTDQVEKASEFSVRNNFDIEIIQIESLGWPEATLLRYSLINDHKHLFKEEVLMYLDADMIFVNKLETEICEKTNQSQMILVQHPGYFRPSGFMKIKFYLSNPSVFARDLRMLARVGALGSWENLKASNAYVPRLKRKTYFCGGIWLGKKRVFLEFCELLQRRVSDDLERNIIAIWHDESHLNWWAANNPYTPQSPKYCFDPTYKQLSQLTEIVRAVDKSSQEAS